MRNWTHWITAAAVAGLISTPSLEAAGSKPAPTPPPSASKTPQEVADEAYNTGLKMRDKAWALEEKAAAADSEQGRQKLLAKAGKQHEKSIPLFLNATERAPSFHPAWSSLGYAYRRTGDYPASLEAYDQALELAPDYGEALEYRAEAYLGLDRLDDAKQAYVKLFALDRALADELMEAMEGWVEQRRAEPGAVAAETIDAFAAWLAERGELAEQAARLTAASERSWGDCRFLAALAAVAVGLGLAASSLAASLAGQPQPGLGGEPLAPGFEWRLPPGFPVPEVPADNPMSAAKVELGRHLFYDPRLSANGTLSCASCHRQERAFTDGRARALGATGELHPRSSMSLANVAYNRSFAWADPTLRSLEDQARVPMFNRDPVELGVEGSGEAMVRRLVADRRYEAMFNLAFPAEPAAQRIRLTTVVKALAAFERTLISGESAYDRRVYRDDTAAMSEPARRGMRLFFSQRLACFECHSGFNFSGPVTFRGAAPSQPAFHNTGLYNLYPRPNQGLASFTGRAEDMGRFRAPTLRNVALTAPYMHDGSIATLGEVIDHYAAGGRASTAAGGRENPFRSPRVRGFSLAAGDKRDLVAFLDSLTDPGIVSDPRFADPWG